MIHTFKPTRRSLTLAFVAQMLGFAAVWAPDLRAQALPTKFDPLRDAAADVALAVQMAKAQGKRVLIDVGGEWCSWCHILDAYFAAQPEAKSLRDANFVWVKVNWSKDNKNEALLAKWPKLKGYPHFFVLDAEGKLVHSQNTGELEDAKSYSTPKMLAFLKAHGPKAQ